MEICSRCHRSWDPEQGTVKFYDLGEPDLQKYARTVDEETDALVCGGCMCSDDLYVADHPEILARGDQ